MTEINTETTDLGKGFTTESLRAVVTVINVTNKTMTLKSKSLDWGKWVDKPQDIKPGEVINFSACGAWGSPSGTEGTVKWSIDQSIVTLYFDCPYNGRNKNSGTCSTSEYVAIAKGTGGDVNQISLLVQKR